MPETRQYVRVAFSPDGSLLATGSPDNKATLLWKVHSTQPHQRPELVLKTHIAILPPMAFSPNGKTLALAGGSSQSIDQTVRLYDLETGELHSLPDKHKDLLQCVAFSPDGKTLASGGADETVILWDAETKSFLRQITGHQGAIWSLAFSRDSETLTTGSWDETIKLWRVDSAKELATLHGHTARVLSLAFSPDGETMASASPDGTFKLWETSLERLTQASARRSGPFTLETVLGRGSYLYSCHNGPGWLFARAWQDGCESM